MKENNVWQSDKVLITDEDIRVFKFLLRTSKIPYYWYKAEWEYIYLIASCWCIMKQTRVEWSYIFDSFIYKK